MSGRRKGGPGRSRQDAIVAVENLFSGKNAPEYYVYIDIKSFYATIQHRWLLSHVPIKKEVLSEMLNAGLLFSGELFPSYGSGISEGSPLSPAIANFTLDRFKCSLHDYILSFRHSQRDLIEGVNKSLSGWAGQYKFCDAYESFREIDSAVQESLLEAAIRHHPKMQKAKLLNHYWYTDTSGVSWYSLECDRSVRVIHLRDAIFFAPNRSRTDINPFFQADYFTKKRREEEMQHITDPPLLPGKPATVAKNSALLE